MRNRLISIAGGIGLVALYLLTDQYSGPVGAMLADGYLGANCTIKGNISIETVERIYHVPGQRYYSQTRISPEFGERWFCSEDDARAPGWRRARV